MTAHCIDCLLYSMGKVVARLCLFLLEVVMCITKSVTEGHGREAQDLCDLPECEQLVCGVTQIAGNRLDLVMTDRPDIADLFIGSLLGTSVQCFVRIMPVM